MPQYQGVWTLPVAARLQSTQQWATDPLYRNTTLLLQADNAPNGAQNNTFLDSSSNNFTITRNGNTTQGTFTPYSLQPGAWGNYFPSTSGSYLTIANNAAFTLGQTFTVECWIYRTSNDDGTIVGRWFAGDASGWLFHIYSTGRLSFGIGTGSYSNTSNSTLPLNTWTHVAVSNDSTSKRLYINGVLDGTFASDNITLLGSLNLTICQNSGGGTGWPGYISNLRIVKGTALYTSNFTPSSTPLTAVANTVLLTCQSNRFVDNSTNNFAITVTGTPSVQAFSPFAPQYQWTAPVISGSGYGGSGVGYLLAPASSNFQYPGDFSIETWVYVTTGDAGPIWGTAGGGGADQIYLAGSGSIFYGGSPSFPYFNSASSVVPYAWSHICITRQSGTLRVMINGILIGSRSLATTIGSATTGPGIFIRASLDDQISGPVYMADLRVCKGSVPTSYQTSSTTAGAVIFTPPTQTVTTTSQGATSTDVSLLLNFTNAGIYDGTMKNGLQTVGNAQINTSIVKYGTGSMYFDGANDALTLPNSPVLQLGSADFTCEFWAYRLAATNMTWVFLNGNSSNYAALRLDTDTSGNIFLLMSTSGSAWAINTSGSAVLPLSTWTHIAAVRFGGTMRLYVNGVALISTTISGSLTAGTSQQVGANFGATQVVNGYVDDLRLTNGIARYTANFTPPTVALPRQ